MIPTNQYIIEKLEVTHLPQAEQDAITSSISKHMEDAAISVLLSNLREDQLQEINNELSAGKLDNDKLTRFAMTVPGLNDKINAALENEWNIILEAFHKIK